MQGQFWYIYWPTWKNRRARVYCDYAGRHQCLARGVLPQKLVLFLLWSGGMLAVAELGWSGSLKRLLHNYAAMIEAASGDNSVVHAPVVQSSSPDLRLKINYPTNKQTTKLKQPLCSQLHLIFQTQEKICIGKWNCVLSFLPNVVSLPTSAGKMMKMVLGPKHSREFHCYWRKNQVVGAYLIVVQWEYVHLYIRMYSH